jgi:hypothetical protein
MHKKPSPLVFIFLATTFFGSLTLVPTAYAKIDPTVSQLGANYCGSATSCSVSVTYATAGNLVVVGIQYEVASSRVTYSISDSKSTSFTSFSPAVSPNAAANGNYYYASVSYGIIPSTGSVTITITVSTTSILSLEVVEISGANTATSSVTGSANSGTAISTSSLTLPSSAVSVGSLATGYAITPGSGFTFYQVGAHPTIGIQYSTTVTTSTTFPATQSTSYTWVELGVAFFEGVTQPINIPTPAGGTAFTYTVSGCSVSPTSASSGSAVNFNAAPSCTLTVSMPAAGTNTRYVFAGSASSTTVTTCASGTCTTFSPADYYQLSNTFQASPQNPTTFSPSITFPITGTSAGVSTTICTIAVPSSPAASTSYSCAGYSDYDTPATFPLLSTNNPPSLAWKANGTLSYTFTTGGNTETVPYYEFPADPLLLLVFVILLVLGFVLLAAGMNRHHW